MRNMIIASAAVLLLAGCADMFKYKPYAREVKRKTGEGGVIALHTEHRTEDEELAHDMMKNVCGAADYKVQEEGEVAVGSKTSGNSQYHAAGDNNSSGFKIGGMTLGGGSSDPSTTQESTTTQLKEWQIAYSCAGANTATASAATTAPVKAKRTVKN